MTFSRRKRWRWLISTPGEFRRGPGRSPSWGPEAGSLRLERVENLPDRRLRPWFLAAAVDPVAVSPTRARRRDQAVVTELGQNPLDRALLDANHVAYLADPNVGVARQADEHLPVIREQLPAGILFGLCHAPHGCPIHETCILGHSSRYNRGHPSDRSASAFLTI